jgi:hypothetical protein
MTAPPNKALPSLRNRRRDAMVTFLSTPVGLVIPSSARNWSAWSNPAKLSRSRGNCNARRRLPRIAARYPLLPVQQGGQELFRFAPSRSNMERVALFRCGHFSICRARFRAGIDCFASVYFQACPGSRIRGLGMTGPPLTNSSGVIAFGPAARVGRRHSGHRYWDSRTQNARLLDNRLCESQRCNHQGQNCCRTEKS